jgi:hypothetical protein
MIHLSFSGTQSFPVTNTIKKWGLGTLITATILIVLGALNFFVIKQDHVFILTGISVFLFAMFNRKLMSTGNFFGVATLSLFSILGFSYLLFGQRYDFETEKWISGFLMVTLVLICVSYKLKKKLSPFVIFGNSRNWRYFHIYSGIGAFITLIFHINFHLPVGFFSNVLFYVVVGFISFSLIGLFLQKWIPLKLTSLDRDVVFEKIPSIVDQMRDRVHSLLYSFKNSEPVSVTLSGFCDKEVFPFLNALFSHKPLFFFGPTASPGNLVKFDTVATFLNSKEKQLLEEVRSICHEKSQLDVHYSLQWMWRIWLWLHIIFSFLLITLVSYHIIFIFIY